MIYLNNNRKKMTPTTTSTAKSKKKKTISSNGKTLDGNGKIFREYGNGKTLKDTKVTPSYKHELYTSLYLYFFFAT